VLAALLIAAFGAAGTGKSTAGAISLAPDQDAYVTASAPKNNFGTATELRAAASPDTRSYLRFTVQGFVGRPQRATLRLYANSASTSGVVARGVTNTTWSEKGIKYNNAPPVSGTATAGSGPIATSTWVSIDVTSLISGNGVFSIAVTTTGTLVSFGSRESSNKPQLVLDADTTPPLLSLTQPADGSAISTGTPTFTGQAGSAAGDLGSVAVQVYAGSSVAGTPVQTLTAPVVAGGYQVQAAPALADGVYSARASQSDQAGNTGTSSANTFTVDTTAPTATIGSGPADPTTQTSAIFAFTSSETGSTYACSLDGAAFTACTSPQAYSGLSPGSHSFQVRATDPAGNTGPAAAASWTITAADTTPPLVTLAQPADGSSTQATTPTFSGTAGTASGDSTSITVRIYSGTGTDGTLVQTLTTTRTASAYSVSASPALADGVYSARASQSDQAGNTGTSSANTFTVDTTAPTATIGSGPADPTTQTSAIFAFTSSETGSTYACSLDGAAFTACTSPQAYSGLSPGSHSFQVRATDPAGNTGPAAAASWTITAADTTPPLVTLAQPADGSSTQATTPTFSGTAGTASGDSTSITVRIYSGTGTDGTLVQTLTTTRTASAYSVSASPALADGVYSARASQSDQAGNTGTSSANTFTVDTTAPSVSVGTPANGSVIDVPLPIFSGTASDGPGDSPTVIVTVYQGTGTGGPVAQTLTTARSGTAWSGTAYPFLADGVYTVVAQQTDAAGNSATSSPSTFTISTAGPQTYKDLVIADGAIAYWRFGEASGTTAVDERGGSNGRYNNGVTLGQPGALAGDSNPAAQFNGSNQNITAAGSGTPSSPLNTLVPDPISLEVWVRRGTLGTQQRIFAKGDGWPVLEFQATNKIRFAISGRGDLAISTVAVVDTTNWHHIVATRSGTNARIYLDGTDVTGTVTNQTSGANANTLAIGSDRGGGVWFNGLLDEAAIYGTQLTASQVQAHYLKGHPAAADLTPPTVSLNTPGSGNTVTDATPTFSGVSGTDLGDQQAVSVRIYSGSTATGTATEVATATAAAGGQWAVDASPPLPNGTYTAQAEQSDSSGNTGRSAAVTFTVSAAALPAGDPVVLTAGDIALCDFPEGPASTSPLLDDPPDAIVATLGDHAYQDGTLDQYMQCYDPTWGHAKMRTRPIPGGHDYRTPDAAGYFTYFHDQLTPFGDSALDPARGWYSYDIGGWHVVALNGEKCEEENLCGAGSPQVQWLQADLASHPAQCTVAFEYAPRFSSGTVHGSSSRLAAIFTTLYNAGVELVVSGDDHEYERFAPQAPDGSLDLAKGVSQFVAGTGGASHYTFGTPVANSEVRDNTSFGVLKLTLHAGAYEWEFVPTSGAPFHDYGSRACH
jgi:large repetitive protein